MFYCPVSRLLLCMLPSRDNGALMQSEICPAKWVAGLSKAYPVRVYVGIASQRSELHIDFSHEIPRQRMHVDRVLPLFAEGPKENSSFKKQTSKQQTKNPCSTNSAVPTIFLYFFLLLTNFCLFEFQFEFASVNSPHTDLNSPEMGKIFDLNSKSSLESMSFMRTN